VRMASFRAPEQDHVLLLATDRMGIEFPPGTHPLHMQDEKGMPCYTRGLGVVSW
jgi:hypothetical protein